MANEAPRLAGADLTVVIAVRNGAAFIEEAVRSALAQEERLDRVIVVDDGSSDATQSIVEGIGDPRVRFLRNPLRGVSSARNFGAAHARTPWLLFLDADDRLVMNAAARLIQSAVMEPRPVAVYGDYERIDSEGHAFGKRYLMRRSRPKPSGAVLDKLVRGNFIINGGVVLVASEAFKESGGFDPALSLCEDWHLWCKLAALGEIRYVSALVMDYRVHTTSVMMGTLRRYTDFLPALERIYSDTMILSHLDPASLPSARQQAEVSLMTYCAAQAYRNGRRSAGVSMMLAAVARHPRRVPYIASRFGGAMVGL